MTESHLAGVPLTSVRNAETRRASQQLRALRRWEAAGCKGKRPTTDALDAARSEWARFNGHPEQGTERSSEMTPSTAKKDPAAKTAEAPVAEAPPVEVAGTDRTSLATYDVGDTVAVAGGRGGTSFTTRKVTKKGRSTITVTFVNSKGKTIDWTLNPGEVEGRVYLVAKGDPSERPASPAKAPKAPKVPADEAKAAKAATLEQMKAEKAAHDAWKAAGEQGPKPETPTLDAENAALAEREAARKASTAAKRTDKSEGVQPVPKPTSSKATTPRARGARKAS